MLTLSLSPRGRENTRISLSLDREGRRSFSLSPWGEGWGEGDFIVIEPLPSWRQSQLNRPEHHKRVHISERGVAEGKRQAAYNIEAEGHP